MYKSPIEMLITNIEHQIVKQQDEEIYKAVLHHIPNIDKEELIRALQYDRNQYEKGYLDGKTDAMASILRCKDCKFWREDILRDDDEIKCCCIGMYMTKGDNFCSFGKRRDDDV